MDTIKSTEIKQKEEYKEDTIKSIENLNELLEKLEEYNKKTINKTFFEKYFLNSNEYRNWTTYSITKSQYSFQKPLKIYIGRNCEIEIDTRDREEIIEAVKEELKKKEEAKDSYIKIIENLKAFNEIEFYKDLEAIYKKYNKPNIWRKLLEEGFYKFR